MPVSSTARRLWEDAHAARVSDELVQAQGFVLRGRASLCGELVVATAGVVRLARWTFALGYQAAGLESDHREGERTRARGTLAVCDLADAFDDAPAVGGAVVKCEEDVERQRRHRFATTHACLELDLRQT